MQCLESLKEDFMFPEHLSWPISLHAINQIAVEPSFLKIPVKHLTNHFDVAMTIQQLSIQFHLMEFQDLGDIGEHLRLVGMLETVVNGGADLKVWLVFERNFVELLNDFLEES